MKLQDLKKLPKTSEDLLCKIDSVFDKLECIETGDGNDCFGWAFRYNDDTTYDITVCFDGTVIEKFFIDGVISEQETQLLSVEDVMHVCEKYENELYQYLTVVNDEIVVC